MKRSKGDPNQTANSRFEECPVCSATALEGISAAILVGGLGTRLGRIAGNTPKPLLPVRGRPFVFYLLDQLWIAGVRDVVLCSGYRSKMIEDAASRYGRSMRILCSQEDAPLGTGGAVRLALPLLLGGPFFVMNGDSFCRFEPVRLLEWHRIRRASCSLLLTQVDDTGRYGRVGLDAADRVVEFEEKCTREGPGWINAGVYLVERSVIGEIPKDRECSLEREVFPRLIGYGLHGYRGGGRFLDIGTPESYSRAPAFFEGEA